MINPNDRKKVELDTQGNVIPTPQVVEVKDLSEVSGGEFLPVQEEASDVQQPKSLEIDPSDITEVFDKCILQDEHFTKDYYIGSGENKIKVVMRTRTASEANEISKLLDKLSQKRVATFEHIRHLLDLNLGYSLVSIGDKNYDIENSSLQTRCGIIDKMPAVKKQLLWNIGEHFDNYVDTIKEKLINL